jgi:hypothetical protein
MLIGVAAVAGSRRAPFRPRRVAQTLALVVMSQALIHVGMVSAPWAFGLHIHHSTALVTPSVAVAHGVATLLLAGVVVWFDRLLGALSRVMSAVLEDVPSRPRISRLVIRIAAPTAPCRPRPILDLAIPSRGPPPSA